MFLLLLYLATCVTLFEENDIKLQMSFRTGLRIALSFTVRDRKTKLYKKYNERKCLILKDSKRPRKRV